MPLLIFAVIAQIGVLSSLGQAQQGLSNAEVAAMVEALRLAAPQTGIKNDGLYSEWQVKAETLRGWSKYCLKRELTPRQFENSPDTARSIVSCIISRELGNQFRITNNENQSVGNVACWWMTGSYTGCNQGFSSTYVNKVIGFYQRRRAIPKG
ncbi:MAG: hypothetical protein GC195_14205 [Nostoc sp. RI_552]|nr:hypothetical protein [Nostoc sp. RI_552]